MRRGILGDVFLIQRMVYYGSRERQRRSRQRSTLVRLEARTVRKNREIAELLKRNRSARWAYYAFLLSMLGFIAFAIIHGLY